MKVITTLIALVQLSLATTVLDASPQLNNNIAEYSSEARQGAVAFAAVTNVHCEADYIGVNVEFAGEFKGVIYSQGFFNDTKCRYDYVPVQGSKTTYLLRVPMKACGSKVPCQACGTFENVLIFQEDDLLQGPNDFAKSVYCTNSFLQVTAGVGGDSHRLRLKPFTVEDLSVERGPDESLKCWMDLQRGVFPSTTPIQDSFKTGESLTILVYLLDIRREFDLSIGECWAYDSEDLDSPTTNKAQLTDSFGCPIRKKIISVWQKATNTNNEATLVAYSKINAFRFPESNQVYLSCNVQLCQYNCNSQCDSSESFGSDISSVYNPECFPGSIQPHCRQTTPTTPKPVCYPGSQDPSCSPTEKPKLLSRAYLPSLT